MSLIQHNRLFDKMPFVRLLLPFILGIISGVYFLHNTTLLIVCACISILLIVFIMLFRSDRFRYLYTWVSGLAMALTLFFLAALLTLHKTEIRQSTHFSKYIATDKIVIADLIEPPVEKDKTLKCIFSVNTLQSKSASENVSGKLLVYLEKDSLTNTLSYGDRIIFPARYSEIPAPQNPYEFNYKRYLAFHAIYHRQFLKKNEWHKLQSNNGNSFMTFIYNTRNHLLHLLKSYGLSGDEYTVCSALLLGYSEQIDPTLLQAYAGTGTLHVLSVSGLHVGLIYIVLNFLFGFAIRFKYGTHFKTILIILFLWMYAVLTGFSPAVLRATVMFSFVAIGFSLRRTTNIYNTLAASCFVLLLFNPYFIFDVGFQLSYLAVLGIVWLQPLIYNWWYTQYWFADQVWKITSVSIAAQLATLPLSLFYFHQFPSYFIFSNLLVIPLSTIIIYNGILFFIAVNIPWLNEWLAKILKELLFILNAMVRNIEAMPHAVWKGISISMLDVIVIYLLLIFGLIYLIRKKIEWLFAALFSLLTLLALTFYNRVVQLKQNKIIVYNIPRTSAIDLVQGNNCHFVSKQFINKAAMQFHVLNNRYHMGIAQTIALPSDSVLFFKSRNKSVLMLSKPLQAAATNDIKPDYIILSANCKVSVYELVTCFDFKLLIFDSGNSSQIVDKWIMECKKLHKPYYNVIANGAFVENI